MLKLIFRLIIIFCVYLFLRCCWAVEVLNDRTIELKNAHEELQAKHNKLVAIVRYIEER